MRNPFRRQQIQTTAAASLPPVSSERGTGGCCCLLPSSFPSLQLADPSASFQLLFLPPTLSPVPSGQLSPAVWCWCVLGCAHRQGGREGAGGPQSCWVMLCWCSSHSSVLGAVPERRELRLPREMLLPPRLDGANLPDRYWPCPLCPCSLCHTCWRVCPGSMPAAVGLWVSFALRQPLRGDRDLVRPYPLSDLGPRLMVSLCTHMNDACSRK